MIKDKPTILSAFCGAGGDTLGLSSYFDIAAGVDSDKDCCQTFKYNFREASVYHEDVQNFSLVQGDFDCIVSGISGGPPCQGSSRLNFRQVGFKRNELTLEVIRLAKEANAKWFLIENVSTFKMKEQVIVYGKKHGFKMYSKILNSMHYGVAQKRKRWFCIGFRDHNSFQFPKATDVRMTVNDVLNQLYDNWGQIERKDHIKERLHILDKKPGVWLPMSSSNFANGIAWNLNEPAPTLVNPTKVYQKIVGHEDTISLAIAAGIQGFPPWYKFKGAKSSVAQQIVNACPIGLAKHLGQAIHNTIQGG